MFGRKNGRRVEPRRIPSSVKNKKKNDDLYCGGCCQSLANCCSSCGAHGWFLTLFCGYVLVSSLPRILIILDFIITLALYFQYNYNQNGVSGFKNQNWIKNSYSFKHSTFDIVIISFIRCIILFICFAYRYQREGFRKNIYISFITVITTSIYLIVKLYFNKTDIVIFSLSFVWIECIFFFMVRRRRIRYAPNLSNHSYYSLTNRNRKIMKPKQSKYYRIDDDDIQNDIGNDNASPKVPLNQPNNTNITIFPSSDNNINITNNTPPPFIYDSYLDEFKESENENKKQKQKESNKTKTKTKTKTKHKQNYNNSSNNNFSIEHSISATVPDSEFSQNELPLRTDNSEFFIIDGVAIHYCIERIYNNDNINNKPWLILLHGFGGGVFSWKQSIPLILNYMDNDINGILAFDRVGFGLTERPVVTKDNIDNIDENKQEEIIYDDKNNPYSIHFSLKIIKTFLDKFEMKSCILIGHSTGGLIANWFAYQYPSYVDALILVSPTGYMPSFVRSILNTKLGKPIILSLVRSEIGQVTLHQAWHNPQSIPSNIIYNYKICLKLKHWNESLLEMARVKPYSNVSKYHKALSNITCPVWILHGDDDKLVTFRESVALSSHYKYCFGPIKLNNCGHIPHEEISNQFVNTIKNIIVQELKQFLENKTSYKLENDLYQLENNNNKIAKKLKQIFNLNRKNSNELKNTENSINSLNKIGEQATPENDNNVDNNNNSNINKVTESSALLSD